MTDRVSRFVDAVREHVSGVGLRDLVLPALSAVAAYMLIDLIGNLDFAAVRASLSNASWAAIALGAGIAQAVYATEALGMRFATGAELPLGPLAALQLSIRWITLAVPSVAGRVGMNAAFLTRFEVPATIAVVQGAVDGLAGFVVEATLLLAALPFVDLAAPPDISVRWEIVLLIVVIAVVVSAVAIWRIRKLKEIVLPVARDALGMLAAFTGNPRRAVGLLAANLGTRLLLGSSLWLILGALDVSMPLWGALVVTVATNLLAGLVPIPGGIGVAETAMTSFLVVAGVDPEDAFAAAVVYRLATFYLPSLGGWVATRWLRRHEYL